MVSEHSACSNDQTCGSRMPEIGRLHTHPPSKGLRNAYDFEHMFSAKIDSQGTPTESRHVRERVKENGSRDEVSSAWRCSPANAWCVPSSPSWVSSSARPLWYLTRPGDAFNGKNGALKMEGEGNMNGCRRNESWNEEIWSGGRSSRRANFCDIKRASRNVQFPFFSFFLFFLDTCPILNFFQENSSILGNFWRRYLCYRVIEIEFMFV